MISLNFNELRTIQKQILDFVVSFCDKNNINYFLDSGTLLGAIRHKGFIPWDDDIDIGMLRDDYDKFISLFNKTKSKFKCLTYENDNTFYYPFAKVMDTSTILYEPNEKGTKLCVNIDVFVYDNANNNLKENAKRMRYKSIVNRLNTIHAQHNTFSKNRIIKITKQLLYILLKPLPKDFFVKRVVKNSKKYAYSNIEFDNVGNFTSVTNVIAPKKIFSNYCLVEFEGNYYKAPIGFDEWLKLFYGDYMILPPIEKRKHHEFVAYKMEDDTI